MIFLIDENLNTGIAEVLKSTGIDAIHVNTLGLAGASDREVLDEAARQKRCVVTRNRNDFLELTKRFFSEGRSHHGVLIVPKSYRLKDYVRIAHAIAWMVHNNPHAFQQYAFLFLPPQLDKN